MKNILVMLKPDLYSEKRKWEWDKVRKELKDILKKVFWSKPIHSEEKILSDLDINTIYKEHIWKDFFERLSNTMKLWKTEILVYEAIDELTFNILNEVKDGIRKEYSLWWAENTIHISSCEEDAIRETNLFLNK